MASYRDSWITRLAFGIFFIVLAGYALFEARGILYGPSIALETTSAEVEDQLFIVKGKAERIVELSMNGMPIFVTEEGVFEEPYILTPGINRIFLDAADKYGRGKQAVIEISYFPTESPLPVLPEPGPEEASEEDSTDPIDPDEA